MIRAGRLVLGGLLAATCAPMIVGIATVVDDGSRLHLGERASWVMFITVVGFLPALAIVLVIALPAYLLLSRYWAMQWWHAALAGFTIGGALSLIDPFDLRTFVIASSAGLISGLVFAAAVIGRQSTTPNNLAS